MTLRERLDLFYDRLRKEPSAESADEALIQIGKILEEVEDEYSGVPKNPNPGLEFDGRMYPPRSDMIRYFADGSIVARTKGNRLFLSQDGSIRIEDLNGKIVFSKPGGTL